MDDTHGEERARRLLTTAYESVRISDSAAWDDAASDGALGDSTVGDDLLRGVRRRTARRRTRTRITMAAGSGAVVAAAAVVGTSFAAVPGAVSMAALKTVSHAASKTNADTYKVTVMTKVGGPPYQFATQMTGEFDPAHKKAQESFSGGRQVRYVGGYAYWKLTSGAIAPNDKQWIRLSQGSPLMPKFLVQVWFGTLGPGVNVLEFRDVFATPEDLLAQLKSATAVHADGRASGPGWTGTKYTFGLKDAMGDDSVETGTVYVDAQGRVRELTTTTVTSLAGEDSGEKTGAFQTVTQDVTFSGFGAPVSVTAPSARDVFDLPDPPSVGKSEPVTPGASDGASLKGNASVKG